MIPLLFLFPCIAGLCFVRRRDRDQGALLTLCHLAARILIRSAALLIAAGETIETAMTGAPSFLLARYRVHCGKFAREAGE